jgi:hypothetical protein
MPPRHGTGDLDRRPSYAVHRFLRKYLRAAVDVTAQGAALAGGDNTMTRVRLLCSLAILMVCGTARPARADMSEVIDYMFTLNGPGPGPFGGIAYEQELACYANTIAERGTAAQQTPPMWQPLWRCFSTDKTKPLTNINFQVGRLHSDSNPFAYAPEKGGLSPSVTAWSYLINASTSVPGVANPTVIRAVRIGGGFGAIRFSGERFNAFWVPYAEIPRITISPLAFLRDGDGATDYHKWKDVLRVRYTVKYIGAVSFGKFGATSGADTNGEVQQILAVEFNIGALL